MFPREEEEHSTKTKTAMLNEETSDRRAVLADKESHLLGVAAAISTDLAVAFGFVIGRRNRLMGELTSRVDAPDSGNG